MIAAVSSNGVMGLGETNELPFHYPADMKHFRKLTANSTVIMGRKTFESIGRPLPKRRNLVISTTLKDTAGIEIFPTTAAALYAANYPYGESLTAPCYTFADDKWFIGGASIYADGMSVADEIYLTLTPDVIEGRNLVRFPWINPQVFELKSNTPFEDDNRLRLLTYNRIKQS